MPQDALTSVAVTTMVTLGVVELYGQVVAGAVAWLAAWWILREPTSHRR